MIEDDSKKNSLIDIAAVIFRAVFFVIVVACVLSLVFIIAVPGGGENPYSDLIGIAVWGVSLTVGGWYAMKQLS